MSYISKVSCKCFTCNGVYRLW